MSELEKMLEGYDYPLEKEQVALSPAEPRDSAQLLVYEPDTHATHITTFAHIHEFLPRDALIVFNNTKVFPARIHAQKETGGIVELLCTEIIDDKTFTALGNRKIEPGTHMSVGSAILTVISNTNEQYRVASSEDVTTLFEMHGETPIPPYLKHTPLSEKELRTKYQSVFAAFRGSIAAPTASLHFTDALMDTIQRMFQTAYVTLHVNLGTFAPLSEHALQTGALHTEHYAIPEETAAAVNEAKRSGRPIIAVGTTALRALESGARDGLLVAGNATTSLFIREGYTFQIVDGLITNFHVPKSSLLMLVATLIGREKLFELYRLAVEHSFKFLSFGDGMLILPHSEHKSPKR